MWHAVYNTNTGALVSLGTQLPETLPVGLSAVDLGAERPAGDWNPAIRAFEVVAQQSVTWAPQDFMGRFTVAEETSIRQMAMSDANMVTFLARVERARTVTNNHPDTIAGMAYCVARGCVTSARRDWILSGQEETNG